MKPTGLKVIHQDLNSFICPHLSCDWIVLFPSLFHQTLTFNETDYGLKLDLDGFIGLDFRTAPRPHTLVLVMAQSLSLRLNALWS